MTRDTAHGTKGISIVGALAAAVLVTAMLGLSTLVTSAQGFDPGDLPGFDTGEIEVPSPLESCQAQFPDTIVDTAPLVEEALAGSDLPPELVDQLVSSTSFTLSCGDLFGGEM